MKSNISASSLGKVTEIFNKNGWIVEEHEEEFNRFCQMLENFKNQDASNFLKNRNAPNFTSPKNI